MDSQRSYLVQYFRTNDKMAFEKLMSESESRIHIIFTFLSLLELVQQGFLTILIGNGRNNLIIERNHEVKEEDIKIENTGF